MGLYTGDRLVHVHLVNFIGLYTFSVGTNEVYWYSKVTGEYILLVSTCRDLGTSDMY